MTGFDLEAVRADHHSPRSYLVRHVTRYEYDAPRVAAYELGRLTPRPTPTQTVRSTATRLEPAPLVRTTHTDRYGNLVDYIEVREPYTVLELAKESIVDVHWPAPDLDALNARTLGETAAHLAAHGDPVEAVEFALPSPLVEVTDAVTREFSVFKHGAVSRKTHGSVGTFDVAVHVPGAVEPRQAGPTKLIVTFNQEVQTPGGPTTEDIALSSGTVTGVAFYTHNGPQLTIDMTGAANQANLVVSYPGLTDDQGAPLAETLCFGVLTGDANGDQRVNIFDLVQVRNALNQAPTQSTFTRDVTADGAINIFDLVAVRNVLNTALANACP